jgi:hypothetical protein
MTVSKKHTSGSERNGGRQNLASKIMPRPASTFVQSRQVIRAETVAAQAYPHRAQSREAEPSWRQLTCLAKEVSLPAWPEAAQG